MKRLLVLLSLLTGLAMTAHATPVLVAYTNQIPTQPGDNGLQTIEDWAKASVVTYNTLNNPDLPAVPDALPSVITPGDANPFGPVFDGTFKSITLDLTGYTGYLVMSWGGSQLDVGNGTAEFLYYVSGEGSVLFTNNSPLAKGGLSSIHYWGTTSVPDGGTTAVLLGLALVGLSFVARRKIA